jgi:hypothetical protein
MNDDAVLLKVRSVCIAGKPGSHLEHGVSESPDERVNIAAFA